MIFGAASASDAQTGGILQHRRPVSPQAKFRQAHEKCRTIALEFRKLTDQSCVPGDRLDAAGSVCIPPRGLFKPYSRWDPAAGRCKPRHRFDGGTCSGGATGRYSPGGQYAHSLPRSVSMYGKALTRLAAAEKTCRLGISRMRSRIAAQRIARQRNCAAARQRGDRSLINLYCK